MEVEDISPATIFWPPFIAIKQTGRTVKTEQKSSVFRPLIFFPNPSPSKLTAISPPPATSIGNIFGSQEMSMKPTPITPNRNHHYYLHWKRERERERERIIDTSAFFLPTQQSRGIFLANSAPRHTSVNKIGQKLQFGPK